MNVFLAEEQTIIPQRGVTRDTLHYKKRVPFSAPGDFKVCTSSCYKLNIEEKFAMYQLTRQTANYKQTLC